MPNSQHLTPNPNDSSQPGGNIEVYARRLDGKLYVEIPSQQLSLETKLITQEGEQFVSDSYMLDGKEVEFTPKTPNGQAGKGKRTVRQEVVEAACVNSLPTRFVRKKKSLTNRYSR